MGKNSPDWTYLKSCGKAYGIDVEALGEDHAFVKELQSVIREDGPQTCGRYFRTDGSYGSKTIEAVEKYQKRHLLKVDGIAGYETVKEMERSATAW